MRAIAASEVVLCVRVKSKVSLGSIKAIDQASQRKRNDSHGPTVVLDVGNPVHCPQPCAFRVIFGFHLLQVAMVVDGAFESVRS